MSQLHNTIHCCQYWEYRRHEQ